ncbi:hypothetical protein ANN_20577 [Periplaneta americana]|uniref:Uncharacterized protein n=1 Tax=Periplaneta americana TaxID=6978 RepID=A0ABQ8SCZ6_PERAM|nr:hypothetical protein ANN_20577 [Periplaneta americana]
MEHEHQEKNTDERCCINSSDIEMEMDWTQNKIRSQALGTYGNDVADREAKQSTKDSTNPDYTFLPNRDFISLIDNKCKESWITLWTLNPSRKLFEVNSTCSINIPIHKLNRKYQVLLSRLRIGHTQLTHSYLISRNEPPTCETCHCLLTVKHVTIECRKYHTSRKKYYIPNDMSTALNNTDVLLQRSANDAPFYNKSFLCHCYPNFDYLAAAHVTAYSTPQIRDQLATAENRTENSNNENIQYFKFATEKSSNNRYAFIKPLSDRKENNYRNVVQYYSIVKFIEETAFRYGGQYTLHNEYVRMDNSLPIPINQRIGNCKYGHFASVPLM